MHTAAVEAGAATAGALVAAHFIDVTGTACSTGIEGRRERERVVGGRGGTPGRGGQVVRVRPWPSLSAVADLLPPGALRSASGRPLHPLPCWTNHLQVSPTWPLRVW